MNVSFFHNSQQRNVFVHLNLLLHPSITSYLTRNNYKNKQNLNLKMAVESGSVSPPSIVINVHLNFQWLSTSTWSWSWCPVCWRIRDSCWPPFRPGIVVVTFGEDLRRWSRRAWCLEIPSRPSRDGAADTWSASLKPRSTMVPPLAVECSTRSSPSCFPRPRASMQAVGDSSLVRFWFDS